jgi:hypothetical protein
LISNLSAVSPTVGGHGVPSRFAIDDEQWVEVQPLIPVRQRRRRYPGREQRPDRMVTMTSSPG